MKILQVIPYFPPAYAFGGPPTVAFQLSKELAKRGHDVTVYTTDAKDPLSRLGSECADVVDGIKIHYFRNASMKLVERSKLFLTPKMLSAAKDYIKMFDVVHLHEYRTFQNVIIHYYAKKYGIPYVLQAHGSLQRIMAKQRLKWIFDAFSGYGLLRDASKVIALTPMEAEQCRRIGVSEKKIVTIPNGIDLSEYANLPPKGSFKEKFNLRENKKIILYLGRIHKTKGIDLLIRAYAYLTNNIMCKDSILTIAGPDDGYLAEAKSLVASSGISGSTLFTGFLDSNNKLEAFVDADLFVTPSFYGFPITFLEACTVGTPIVTTKLGDSLEWINGNVGYVTSPKSDDIAKAIYSIISNNQLRQVFSKKCKQLVESEFSMKKVADRLECVYQTIV